MKNFKPVQYRHPLYFLICFFFHYSSLSEGKIPPDEPSLLPPLPIVPKPEKRKSFYGTPQSKKIDYRDREWDRDKDFELMPPPGSNRKDLVPIDEQPIDPNEPTYCVCHQVLITWILQNLWILWWSSCDLSLTFGTFFSGVLWRHDCLWQWECESVLLTSYALFSMFSYYETV